MAADLHIHIVTPPITEEDVRLSKSHSIGSKYCPLTNAETVEEMGAAFREMERLDREQETSGKDRWAWVSTPDVWIGEVSWLKAGLTGDDETYIPDTISAVYEIVGEDFQPVTEEMISRIVEAFKLSNKTSYSLNDPWLVADFLRQHLGEPCFTSSH